MSEHLPDRLSRQIRDDERCAYERDGVVVLRGILDPEWVQHVRAAIERVLARPGPMAAEYTLANHPGRYYVDFFLWRRWSELRAFAHASPMPELAAQLMGAATVRLFYDQMFVKEPGTAEVTPWHQDLSYWPVRGEQVLSLWIPFDHVVRETGAVIYIKGSHRWGKLFRPVGFSPGTEFDRMYKQVALEPLPDIDAELSRYELLHWDVSAGDVIAHHPLTVHCAGANRTPSARRRALALRYIGDDVRYDARPGTFLNASRLRDHLPPIALSDGDAITGGLFPVVWPRGGA